MWCLKRFGLATAVLMAALPLGSLAQASVVVSNGGSMGLNVYATVAPDHPDYFVNEYHETIFDDDHASFSGTPTALSVSASARLSYLFLASASIAVDARSEWTSPDHGTVDINSIGSRYQAPAGFEAGYGQLDGGPWGYSFTPTVDAVLTLSASGTDLYNGRYYVDTDVKFYVNNISHTYSLRHGDVSASFNLNAGTVYGISVFPWFTDEAVFTPKDAIDYTRISTRHFTFDIVAAPTTPPPPPIDSGVPEPGAWVLLFAGFGIVGAAMRRRREVIAASASAGGLANSGRARGASGAPRRAREGTWSKRATPMIMVITAAAAAGASAVAQVVPPAVPLGGVTSALSCAGEQSSVTTGSTCSAGNSSASVTLGPLAAARAEATYPGQLALVQSGASASLIYFFEIVGGDDGASVPLNILLSLEADASNTAGNSYAFAAAKITTDLGAVSQTICTYGCGAGDGKTGFHGVLSLFATVNHPGFVELSAVAANGLSVNSLSANAVADPYIYVDPSFADAARYSVVVSDGVGNSPPASGGVPEPATWAMLLSGFGVVGSALRTKRVATRSRRDREPKRHAWPIALALSARCSLAPAAPR